MAWHLSTKNNRPVINYLLIILVFALLVMGIYLFFKFKINAMEKGGSSSSRYYTSKI